MAKPFDQLILANLKLGNNCRKYPVCTTRSVLLADRDIRGPTRTGTPCSTPPEEKAAMNNGAWSVDRYVRQVATHADDAVGSLVSSSSNTLGPGMCSSHRSPNRRGLQTSYPQREAGRLLRRFGHVHYMLSHDEDTVVGERCRKKQRCRRSVDVLYTYVSAVLRSRGSMPCARRGPEPAGVAGNSVAPPHLLSARRTGRAARLRGRAPNSPRRASRRVWDPIRRTFHTVRLSARPGVRGPLVRRIPRPRAFTAADSP